MTEPKTARDLAESIYDDWPLTMDELTALIQGVRNGCAERAIDWWLHDPHIKDWGALDRLRAAIKGETK